MQRNGWKDSERELRFLLSRPQAEQFFTRSATRLRLDDHHRLSPVAYTRTTYFDTDDLEHLRSCAGQDPKVVARRVRIREYAAAAGLDAPPLLTGHCFLELKESRGPVRRKVREAVAPDRMWSVAAAGARRDPCAVEQVTTAPELTEVEDRIRSGHLRARLTTWYRRWSFHARSEPLRITFDEGLAYCRAPIQSGSAAATQWGAGQPGEPGEVVAYGPSRIIEVKYRGLPPTWLVQAVAGLQRRRDFSKFQMGMRALLDSRAPAARKISTRPLTIPGRMHITAA